MTIQDHVGNGYRIKADVPHFGIELEVERAMPPGEISDSLWTTVGDGSLRNSGVEFLSSRPFTKAEVVEQVPLFYDWMTRYNYDRSIRTSTHVHVNVLAMTEQQVQAACIVYTLVEPLLFRYCGRMREENIYCVPWYRATDEVKVVRDMHDDIGMVRSACKYSALYLEPILRFGTLEFRHAPVFDTAGQLLSWVDMCERVVYSGFESIDEVLDTFEELSADEFVQGIFGDELTRVLRGVCDMDFEELMEHYDVQTTAELALACTYKPTTWDTIDSGIEGTGTDGYHRHAPHSTRFDEGMEAQPYEPEYDEREEEY